MKLRARFVVSAAKADEFPANGAPEVAVVGRSNVGKSSLINALVGQDGLARTSRTPGRTRLVNWFEVAGATGKPAPFYLVDFPGYGYAEVPKAMRESWRPLIESYLEHRTSLAGVLLLVDTRRTIEAEELDFAAWLGERAIPIVVALTKSDKLAKHQRTLAVGAARRALAQKRDPFAVSATDGDGLEPLVRALLALVEAAR